MSQVPEVTPQHRSQEMMPSLACATVPQVAIPGVATRRGKLFRYTPIVERGASKMLTILDAICAGDMRSIQSKQKLIADLEACGYLERRAANEVDEESRGLSLLARRLDQQIRSSTQWQKGARQEAQRLKRWGKSKLSAIINVCTFGRYGEEQQRRVETLAEEMRRQQKIASSACLLYTSDAADEE